MKLGDVLKFSAGLIAGTVLLAASAQAAPVPPLSAQPAVVPANVEPAVVSQGEVDQMKPVLVHWHHHHHHHWHHRWHHRHHWHHRWHRHHHHHH